MMLNLIQIRCMEVIDLRPERQGKSSRVLSYGWGEQRVALKMLPSSNKKGCDQLRNQFAILQALHHPHIIKAFKLQDIGGTVGNKQMSQLRQPQAVLVLEFANQGSLLHFIQKQHPKINLLHTFFRQIAKGLAYTHSLSIAHRDIKLENILVFQKGGELQTKISDFGLASHCAKKGKTTKFSQFRGSEMYMAPEIWKTKEAKEIGYDAIPTDVFALGVTLFAMVYGRMPFRRGVEDDQLYGMLMNQKEDQFWKFHGTPVCFQTFTIEEGENFRELFLKMVSFDPQARPTMEKVLSHPFLVRQL